MRIPIILLTLLASVAFAQSATTKASRNKRTTTAAAGTSAAKEDSWPLETLTITGNHIYTSKQIIAVTGLKLGQAVSEGDFDAARTKLLATGAFTSIAFRFAPSANHKGYAGTFEVSEVDQVYPFRFERLPATAAEMTAWLKQHEPLFESKIPGTQVLLERFAKDLQPFVESKGYKGKVIGRVTSDAPGELVVVFRPAAPPPAIASVAFTGNKALPNTALHSAFAQVAVGMPYSEKLVRQMLDSSIRPLYEARGRLQVAFPSVESEPATDVEGVAVKVRVDEGPSFKFGDIKVDSRTLGARELLKVASLNSGDTANFDSVKDAVDRIQKRFHGAGYLHSEVTVERHLNDKDKTVDVVFRTNSGPLYEMGKLTIKGLDIESEPAIRKVWGMAPGKSFDANYPQMFLDRIKEDGYFDNLKETKAEQSINEQDHTVDVTLTFVGGKPAVDPARKQGPPR